MGMPWPVIARHPFTEHCSASSFAVSALVDCVALSEKKDEMSTTGIEATELGAMVRRIWSKLSA